MALFTGARASFGIGHKAFHLNASFFILAVRLATRTNEAAKRPHTIRNMGAASMEADALEKKKGWQQPRYYREFGDRERRQHSRI
jgi:hypothetical protein